MTRDRDYWIPGVAACALAALLVAFHIQRAYEAGGFWRDEIGTIGTATAPSLRELWGLLKYSTPPVLRYAVARAWIGYAGFGTSEGSLRTLGLIGGLALVAGLWQTLRTFGCRFPLLSLILFAANPAVVQWGDSFRGYGLSCLAILFTYAAIWRLIETPTTSSMLLALGTSVASVHFAFQNAAAVAALCIAAIVACIVDNRARPALLVLAVGIASLVSLTPYAAMAAEYQVLNALPSVAFAPATVAARLVSTAGSGSPFILGAWLGFLIVAFVLALGRVVAARRPPGPILRQTIYHSIVLVAAVPAFAAFCVAARLQVNPWHCLMVLAVLTVAAESLIVLGTSGHASAVGRIVAVALIAAAVIPRTSSEVNVRQTNLDLIARHLEGAAAQTDFIVINPWFFGISFNWYYHGQTRWSTLPPLPASLVHRYDLLIQKTAEREPNAALYSSIERSLLAGSTVWMVGGVALPSDSDVVPFPPEPQWLSGDYVNAWTLQLGAWLKAHGVSVAPVDVGLSRPVSVYEDAGLYKLSGWNR